MARVMKDSGVEWIGEIPEGWKVSPVKNYIKWKSEKGYPEAQVLSLYRDFGIVPKDSRDDNHNVTSLDTSGYKYVEVGDLVINKMKAWQGSIAVSKYSGIVSPAYHVCQIVGDGIYKQYLHYLLRNPAYLPEYMRLSTGMRVGQWDLGFDDFKNIPIVLPDMLEQKRIVSFLDAECARIDAVIEQTRASIEEYKKLKQSVITQAVTKGIRPGRKMKDSGVEWIGEIPESFTRRKLKTFSEIISKGTTPKEMKTEFNDIYTVRYIKSENIVANRLQELPLFTITEQIHFGELQRSKLSDRDILFVIAGASIGKVAIMRKDMLPANTNQATCFIRINTQYFKYQKYIWYVLQADFIKMYIQLFAVQSAQPNLSMADLGDLFIPVPSEEDEVYHITEYLDSMCAHIDFLTNQKEQLLLDLESYKKSLIFEYVTGKKEVM